jgi:spermidine/putrescine transport system substrate-binding protein
LPIEILCWEGYDDPLLVAPFALAGGEDVHAHAHVSDYDAAQRVLGDRGRWDLLNINSPYVRDLLHPRGRIRPLDPARFAAAADHGSMPASWLALQQWGRSADGEILGVCQRFGPFNLVVDTDAISVDAAEDQGFDLAADPRHAGRYGILAYDDFNVLHIALAAGLDPYAPLLEPGFARFAATARRWFSGAKVVTADHLALNRALAAGDIAFHLGGGVYTASCARREGHARIRAITPRRGGIAFVEVNALLDGAPNAHAAEDYLAYLQEPQAAVRAALAANAANPVLQMCDPQVFAAFDSATLDAMQWDTLEPELDRCAQYRIAPDYPRLHALMVAARSAAGW